MREISEQESKIGAQKPHPNQKDQIIDAFDKISLPATAS
jgi:hypothetical protein